MSMKDYEAVRLLMEENSEIQDFVGQRSPSLVQAAEKALNIKFPPTYRRFVTEYGAGNFGSAEVCGIINENFTNSAVPNGIWYTLTERRGVDLPSHMVVVYEDGTGMLYCIDCFKINSEDECPIVVFDPGNGQISEQVAEDFGRFLLNLVNEELD